MATRHELRQAEKAKQKKLVDTVAGTAAGIGTQAAKTWAYKQAIKAGGTQFTQARSIYGGELLGGAIELIGNLGIAAWSFFTQKKAAKKKERLTRKQAMVRQGVDGILATIEDTGLQLVDEGFEPGTQEFEKQLYNKLFLLVGYRGNCNAIAWVPGTKPNTPNRSYMFKVTGNGRKLTAGPGLAANVPNLQTYWYTRCKNAKDMWVNAYIQKLTAEGRIRELEAFQASLSKGKIIVRVVFGLLITILIGIFAVQSMRIK